MTNLPIIFSAVALLAGLLYFEKNENRRGKLPAKTMLSGLFMATALVQPHPVPAYYYFLIIGLSFCLGGDVFLALNGQRMFLFGLVSFLLGHLFYMASFFITADLSYLTLIGGVISIGFSGGVFFRLRPHLGRMSVPVVAYIAVITLMLTGAWTVLGDAGIKSAGRIFVFVGAVSFYISDLYVARDRFLKTEFKNRLLGLPLYYFGQFLLAFSIGLVG